MSQPGGPILIASDLSPASDEAVARGLRLADQRRCAVSLLHVIREEPLWWVIMSRELEPSALRDELAREATAGLRDQVRQAVAALGIDAPAVEVTIGWGKPAAEIVETADAGNTELIVVGADRKNEVSDWVVGSTAEKLVRASASPVLVVRRPSGREYGKVVVAVDFSPASREALAHALELAPTATFTLIHAYETWFEAHIDPSTYERLRREQESALHDRLRALAREAGVRGCHEVDYRVVSGPPGTTMLDIADRLDADLIACGTQGETGLRHLLLGSVAQQILRSASTDVLTVRAPDPEH